MTPLCECWSVWRSMRVRLFSTSTTPSQVCYKDDQSPVTEATSGPKAIILERLAAAFPQIPGLPKSLFLGPRPGYQRRHVLSVDPLRRHEGNSSIAERLHRQHCPHRGQCAGCRIVYAPAQRCAMSPMAAGRKSFLLDPAWALEHRQADPVRMRGAELTGVASRSHNSSETEAFSPAMGDELRFRRLVAEILPAGEGMADVYPRFGPRWSGYGCRDAC